MRVKKPKWAKPLNKKDLQHIADVSANGKATLRVAKENANNELCVECRCIGTKLKLAGVIK